MASDASARALSLIVRLRLWREDKQRALELELDTREDWVKRLRRFTSLTRPRAEALLAGAPLGEGEVGHLVEVLGVSGEEEVFFEVEGVDVPSENVRYLLSAMPHKKGEFASRIGKDPTTISRWATGKTRPPPKTLEKIADFFGLRAVDLSRDPVFLSWQPPTPHQRRELLKSRVDSLGDDDLAELYPALLKLLK